MSLPKNALAAIALAAAFLPCAHLAAQEAPAPDIESPPGAREAPAPDIESPPGAREAPPLDLDSLSDADFTGGAITLNIEEVDIRALLGLLAQTRRLNIVAGPEVTGTVSVNLFEVPFEDALDSILGIAGFTHFKKGAIIFVTKEEAKSTLPMKAHDLVVRTFDLHHVEPDDLLATVNEFLSLSGKAALSTTSGTAEGASMETKLIVRDAPEYLAQIASLIETLDVPPYEVKVFDLDYLTADEVLTAIEGYLSPNGKATVGTENQIVVQDSPEYLANVACLVASLDAQPGQVRISSKILNLTRTDDMKSGVQFGTSTRPYDLIAFDASLPFVPNPRREIKTLTTGEGGLFSTIIHDHEQAFVEALSERGNIEVLAEPELLALHGEQATMIIGDKLGYKTNAQADNNTTFEDVQFLDVGTQLEVTPYILGGDVVKVEVAPKVSTGEINPLSGVPNEKTVEVQTTMLVRNGETILIGGLHNFERQRTRSQVPILGEIPLIGRVFGRSRWVDKKGELIILITPHIVGTDATPYSRERSERVDGFEERLSTEKSDLGKLFEEVWKRPYKMKEPAAE